MVATARIEAQGQALPRQGLWNDHVVQTSHGRLSIRETAGQGLPVLLVHGNSASKEVFGGVMDGELGARYRMVAIDLPGHGASEDAIDPVRDYTVSGYADAVIEVAERLGMDRYAILGWSLGGHVALEVLAAAPGVAGVALTGAPPIGQTLETILAGFRPSTLAVLAGQKSLTAAEVTAFAAAAGIAGDPAFIAAVVRTDGRARARMFADLIAGGASDERAIVETMSVPLAIIDGADDPLVNGDYVDALRYGSLWEGKRHLVPAAGHAPFLDAPAAYNATLARFLAEVEVWEANGPGAFAVSLGF